VIITNTKYRIYELSAIAIMRNAKPDDDGIYRYYLKEEATRKCIAFSAPETQDDCAMFYQTMAVLHNGNFNASGIVEDLKDIIVYIDFSNIFNRRGAYKKYVDRINKARDMFRPEGISLDLGTGSYRYIAFERSASMSRQSRLSFIREDFYEPVKERIMLGMKIGNCQLSKLYAYNGLMFTDGFRVEDMSIWDEKKIIVIDNPTTVVHGAHYVTVKDDGTDNPMRRYERVETVGDLEVMEFDGEGLISPRYAKYIDGIYCGDHTHTSFQIRMPYIKGVVHEVDFASFLSEFGVTEIKDIWGERHKASDIAIILTKSMFKGFGWMTENGLTWEQYVKLCKDYKHALYISEVGQTDPEAFTQMNYQFLTTAAIQNEEFRPADLPLGWTYSPEQEERYWITKPSETQYYRFAADEKYRLKWFINNGKRESAGSKDKLWASILKKNPKFINEKVFTKEMEARSESIINDYALGTLISAGDNRYLSGDLLRFLRTLGGNALDGPHGVEISREYLGEGEFYAPCAAYMDSETYTLLRNPHIARNEEAVANPVEVGYYRQKYLSHLNYVVMVASDTLIPERLGGADFDGDMVKTIADPLMNKCVARNYSEYHFDFMAAQIPVLHIPSATPQIRDANDWQARFETVRSTFDERIGQICNAAFDRSIIAYDENSSSDEREKMRKETETLEILTGLEIDSAKSGVKPDIEEYFGFFVRLVPRSLFLKYKTIVKSKEGREWYEPTIKEKLDAFFENTDWDTVSSNVEKLPYYARMLEMNTSKLKPKPAKDAELFSFAKKNSWVKKLDPKDMELMRGVISDYNEALRRIRISRIKTKQMTRRRDIERILFSRAQEEAYTPDELYGVFQDSSAEEIHKIREALSKEKWHLLTDEEREEFLLKYLPYDRHEYLDLFADARAYGFRILIDMISDLDDMYVSEERKKNAVRTDTDSELINDIMANYTKVKSKDYRDQAASRTRLYMSERIDPDTALKCAVALKKRDFAMDVLLDRIEENAVRG